jgi:trans-2,3-dihydro-3-hydroxyanthranilate isomerase
MRSYRYLHLDVFTDRLFGGNQLAVYLDGRGLERETMQAIANEMNFSETTFVLPPERPDTDLRLRIFTPHEELPMAGHPTIGTAFALARSGTATPRHDALTFGLNVGPIPVSFEWRGSDLVFAWMRQFAPTFAEPIQDRAGIVAALGLPPDPALATTLPAQVVSCGAPFLLVPLARRADVDAAALDRAAYARFRESAGLDELPVFVFSPEPAGDDDATVYSRMFGPGIGIVEDPATGGACGPVGSYLVEHGVVSMEAARAMVNLQGVKMGRPSRMHMSIGVRDGTIDGVRVGGTAVVAGEGTLYV